MLKVGNYYIGNIKDSGKIFFFFNVNSCSLFVENLHTETHVNTHTYISTAKQSGKVDT